MSLTLGNVTFDCQDPGRVSAFWAAALDRVPGPDASEFFVSLPGTGGAPNLFFLQVPEGKAGKNRVHLDFGAEDREAEVARLVALGATRVADHDEWGVVWTVLADVEGNEFCVAQGGH